MDLNLRALALTLSVAAITACGVSHPNDASVDGAEAGRDGSPDGTSCVATVVSPINGAVLGPSDSTTGSCTGGFVHDVVVATSAPAGTVLELLVNGSVSQRGTAQGPALTFRNVQLASMGTAQIDVRAQGSQSCGMPISVTVDCGTPTCSITAPVSSTLNHNNNVSSSGYAVAFTVQTDIEDGQAVALTVNGVAVTPTATARGGQATFTSVTLPSSPVPATATVLASCTNRAGTVGQSASRMFTIYPTLPALTITSPTAGMLIPFSVDVDPGTPGRQFQVCGHSDAAGQQLCGEVAGAMPITGAGCVAVPSSATTDGCVEVTCPSGSAPFNVQMNVTDLGGNTTVATVSNISCASSLPSVRIASPAAYSATDATTILNASQDADPTTPGLQHTVVVCSDASAGAVQLLVGGSALPGGTGTLSAATAGDPCAMLGLASTARIQVTLPETLPDVSSAAQLPPTGPILSATVTAAAGLGTSPDVLLWVDTLPPSLRNLSLPCGAVLRPDATGNATTTVSLNSDVLPVSLAWSLSGGSVNTATASTYFILSTGLVQFNPITLMPGTWGFTASATDPAGNTATTASCSVLVGSPPTITFTSPTEGQIFNATGDPDPATLGYQNVTITVQTSAPVGSNVTLTIAGGTAIVAPVTAGGVATFAGITLPEGATSDSSVALVATTDNIAGTGVGTATINVFVDTLAPGGVTNMTATVTGRRAGAVQIAFDDAADPFGAVNRAVARYDIRSSTAAITATNFSSATVVSSSITPGAPGAADSASTNNLELGKSYYFAIRAIDGVGNVGPVMSTDATALNLDVLRITDTTFGPTGFLGGSLASGFDVSGDGIPDVIVGSSAGIVRVYFGSNSATGLTSANYTTISGSHANSFGQVVASLGDFDGDGIGDIAISEGGANQVLIFLGRTSWPATLTSGNADVIIAPTAAPFATGGFGNALSAAGDFNNDGLADVAIGAPSATVGSSSHAGAVVVVLGRAVPASSRPATLAAATDLAFTMNGSIAGGYFGYGLAGLGRAVGSDLYADLGVYSFDAPETHSVFTIVSGRSIASPMTTSQSSATFSSTATVVNDFEGAIGAVGDINNDGLTDLAVGSEATSGVVQLLFGDAGGGVVAGPVISNASGGANDAFGTGTVFLAPGGGLRPSLLYGLPAFGADLAVGTEALLGQTNAVVAYPGRASWAGVVAGSFDYEYLASFAGETNPTAPVSPGVWAGDANHDGYPDVVLGQPANDTIYLVY